MKNNKFAYGLVILLGLVVSGCGGGDGGGGGGEQSLDTISASDTINQSGGSISLTDGSKVTFDVGVVPDGTQVTVYSTAQPAPDSTQEVQALSRSIEIDLPSGLILDSANPDFGITVEFPVSDNAARVAATVAGADNKAAFAKSTSTKGLSDLPRLSDLPSSKVIEVAVVTAGTALDTVSTFFGKLIPNSKGNAIVTIGMQQLCSKSICKVAKLVIKAKDAIECTKQSTQLYQVDFQNDEPIFSTDILHNGKPPLILVHGWQELGIIGFSCDKPYSSTWQRFLEEFALDSTISDQFQVFSLGYSTSNSIKVLGNEFAQKLQAEFGQDPVYVVAHSMGGIVARSALVNDRIDIDYTNANIHGLVMLATPNHGTPIASEESVDFFTTGKILSPFVDFIIGGEGIKDLAWDNFDGAFEFHDRRGNLGNPVLKRLNDADDNYGKYVVFAGNNSLFGALIGAIVSKLGYDENDMVVPLTSALFYKSNNVQEPKLERQKLYQGISHLSIMNDEEILADTRAALLGFLSILPQPIPGIMDGATSVSVNSAIGTSFSRPIDALTLNTSTFQIAGPDGLVAGTIAYNAFTLNATFTPTTPLANNTDYTATITTGVTDTLGNSMESDFSWSFTTGGGVDASPAAPTLSLTPTAIKTFSFSWIDVSGETEYRLFENPDGASGYTQVATIAADANSHDLVTFLPARVNASYLLSACNSDGCSDSNPVFVSGSLVEAVGYVKASNTDGQDAFGYSVALSADGNTLAVGAYLEYSNATGIGGDQTDNSASGSGAVYVFTRSGSTWSQQAYVKASNTDGRDLFGHSVALSADGNTLAVGAMFEDSNATGIGGDQTDNSASESGAVYVFTRNVSTWSQQAYVKASNTDGGDSFGYSVALSADGNTLAVGATDEDSNATGIGGDQADNSVNRSGAVYVFTRSGSTWSQQAYVKASNTYGGVFGHSVALSADGNTLAVGARGESSNATGIGGDQTDTRASLSGAVYVFTRSGSTWLQQAYVKASNTDGRDWFGYSVALSADGNTLAVGAMHEGSNATGIGGDQTDNSVRRSGAVYVFTRNGSTWSQQAYVKDSSTGPYDIFGDSFGHSVALSADGNTLAVGATGEDSNATGIGGDQTDNSASGSGAVYVFTRNVSTWSQQAYVKASNTDELDRFAIVALSGDGNTLAVGAWGEASNATGIGGDQTDNSASESGAVYVY